MATSSRAKFVVYQDKRGWHWKLVVRGDVVAHSAKDYKAERFVRRAVGALEGHVSTASVVNE